ncbi:protein translocase subunit SecF [Bradymonadaceae bacterium TMQ3]|uniref:Protein-export membrane protein SecF n=1 Tax=Lujinxingia sediminis TaxID=2480984 RepID=A0ABY0CY37_9DELT|nr:protein translocase subunit SecF [Lujinxingia sediminis]RDV39161.1 protein translocase subunit SecF [Bradymonadaceae bacterium TMQ3]RVU48798.1 protein translocase subunit SecF [Lujinxingia sediminis]TXC78091.1 protein translocase subunit SecF [Bradymonadales bacterium TMQ1]
MKMFQIYPYDAQNDIIGKRKITGIISIVLMIASVVLLATIGPKWGIDFRGGTELIIKVDPSVTDDEVREAAASIGLTDASVQRYGAESEGRFMIQTQEVSVVDEVKVEEIRGALDALGDLDAAIWDEEQPDRMDLRFSAQKDTAQIEEAIVATGLTRVSVETAGQAEEAFYTVRFQDLQNIIREGFAQAFGEKFTEAGGLERLETVGPRAGEQLRNSGLVSIIVALLAILVYIWFRFDIRYSPGAVGALAHDVTIALGLFVVLQIEISLPIIAAVLTIIGYSLNDTIVLFDRIREDLDRAGTKPLIEVVNEAMNETLSRTLITSLTTLLAVTMIAIIGTGLIQDFAVALIIGIVIGTYSSIFIAAPLMVRMDGYLKERRKAQVLLDKADADQGASV